MPPGSDTHRTSAAGHSGVYSDAVNTAARKAMIRLVPFLILMYIVAFLDRTNIGFAQEAMEVHAGISAAAYALGAGLFFIGYAVFEVPSNLIMHKVGARWWMARIMVTWGIIAACFMFVSDTTSFYVLRFALGVAEAGFFPGVILYLTYWFPQRLRGSATALFYIGLPAAQVLGGPLSGSLMEMDGFQGLLGYQWMFLIEGAIAVVVGILAIFYLTDRPIKAGWLSPDEKKALEDTLDEERQHKDAIRKPRWWEALFKGRVLYFCLIYFLVQAAVYGLSFFMPQQIADISGQKVGFTVGILTMIPWGVALIGTVLAGRIADSTGRYRSVAFALLAISGIGLFAAAIFSSAVLAMIGLCLAALGFCAAQAVFWSLPTAYLSGSALAASIGLINGVGNLGGFVAPSLRVWVAELFMSPAAGLYMLAACPLIAALLTLQTRMFDRHQ